MKLEDLTAEVRPRRNWEAVDLGFSLARKHMKHLLKAWCITVLPLWVLIIALLHQHPMWCMTVLWFLKPIYERVPLFVLSRELFGVHPSLMEILKAWPKMVFGRLWVSIGLGRLSPYRTLFLPINQLEGLKGSKYSRRKSIIASQCGSISWVMQIGCILIMHAMWVAVIMFGLVMIPARFQPDLPVFWSEFWNGTWIIPVWLDWTWKGLYLISLSIMTQFHVASGFALYLNARARLEGWDIEITFRRLTNRIRNVAVSTAAILCGLFLAFGTNSSHAQEEGKDPSEVIRKVMEHPDLEVQSVREWVSEREAGSSSSSSSSTTSSSGSRQRSPRDSNRPESAEVSRVFVWIVIAVAIVLLVAVVIQNLHSFRSNKDIVPIKKEKKAKVVMGMNVEKKSLPKDIVTTARELWANGQHQEALALLYRGAISWLVNSAELPIRESDTEIECANHARNVAEPGMGHYFQRLTRAWVKLAYGKRIPDQAEMDWLFSNWPFHKRPGRNNPALPTDPSSPAAPTVPQTS